MQQGSHLLAVLLILTQSTLPETSQSLTIPPVHRNGSPESKTMNFSISTTVQSEVLSVIIKRYQVVHSRYTSYDCMSLTNAKNPRRRSDAQARVYGGGHTRQGPLAIHCRTTEGCRPMSERVQVVVRIRPAWAAAATTVPVMDGSALPESHYAPHQSLDSRVSG